MLNNRAKRSTEKKNKRIFDLIMSVSVLIMLMPVILTVALFALIINGPPIIFSHDRIGCGGKPFVLYKFRSMSSPIERKRGEFNPGDKSRVTLFGRFLRKTKLDELPQLWNVVKGDMSMVGPRPEVKRWVDAFPKRWEAVLTVRPGITDPASNIYRNEEEILANCIEPNMLYRDVILPHKLTIYEEYIKEYSFGMDMFIIWQTITVLFKLNSGHRHSNERGDADPPGKA
jgi:lipopolysaccharide/colanic/teichoic acid biosynthesis glycosyltransferase